MSYFKKSSSTSYFLNRKTKTWNINEDTGEMGNENQKIHLENETETNKESFDDQLSEQFEDDKHYSLVVEKHEEITKLGINIGNSYLDGAVIDNLQTL